MPIKKNRTCKVKKKKKRKEVQQIERITNVLKEQDQLAGEIKTLPPIIHTESY